MSGLFTLPTLSQDFSQLPASDPASAFYVPPTGSYQNDAGAVIPVSQTNTVSQMTPTQMAAAAQANLISGINKNGFSSNPGFAFGAPVIKSFFGNLAIESIVFMILGLLLIAAGVFGFKQTSNIITSAGKTAAEVAA